MRYVKMLFVLAIVAAVIVPTTTHAQSITQYGKAAMAGGYYPGGPNAATYSGRTYVSRPVMVVPAPVIATTPATDGRRTFSAEPSTPAAAAPAAAPAPTVRYYYWRCR
jgi:hypothetical protein